MAGRVNIKFVAGLVGAAVVVLGVGLWLFWSMVNKTGETHATAAREFEARGDWRSAEESWGRAVGHERTNLEWLQAWRDAIGQITPSTQTEYENFYAQQVQIFKQIAVTARGDVGIASDYLETRAVTFRRMGFANRALIEGFQTEANLFLAYFPQGGATQDAHNRIRGYRGIAWAALAGPGSVLTEAEINAAKEDLRAALSSEPGRGEAVRSLLALLDTERTRAENAGAVTRVAEIEAEKQEAVAGLLAADPESIWGRVSQIELGVQSFRDLPEAARAARRAELAAELDGLFTWLDGRLEGMDTRVLERVALLESVLTPERKTERSQALYEKALAAFDGRTELLLQLGALKMDAGDYAGAKAAVERAEAQPWLPVTTEGMLRVRYKSQAPMMLAEFAVRHIDDVETSEEIDALLAEARSARERFAQLVGVENSGLNMIDGQIAMAEGELAVTRGDNRAAGDSFTEALAHFGKFNELTEYTSRDGLWREGRVAARLGKTGLAKQRFDKLRELDPSNPSVYLAMAEVEESLGTQSSLREAFRLAQRASELSPGSPAIAERLERLRLLTFQQTADDPVQAVIFESERLLTGVDSKAPDAIGAERVIREALAQHPGDTGLIRQMVRVLMNSDRLEDAKSFIKEMQSAYPDNETVANLSRRLDADSMAEVMILGIDESNLPEIAKLLRKIEVYRRYDENARAEELLAEAVRMAPDDPDVVEQSFLQALSKGEMDEAQRITDRAKALNADKLDGITYEARLLAARNNHQGAIELLREAVSRRSTEAPLWRLYASEQMQAGRINDALLSYRRALEISVDDPMTIRAYVASLATTGRQTEALQEARRLREFGERDPAFTDLYLRLEATAGGDEGRQIAIDRRRQLLGERPFDTDNKLELANLYIEARQWPEARKLIDELGAAGDDSLRRVEVLARWFADQGRVRTEEGFRDGIELARGAFINYIVSRDPSKVGVDAYIAMARFMLDRGRDDVALRAIEEARPLQDPGRLRAEKLFGEVMMRRNLPRQAAESFQKIVDAGADDPGQPYRKLLIEMFLRINEYDKASAQLDALGADQQDDLTVLMQRTDIAMARDQMDEAMKLVDRAIQVHPTQPLPFIKRAQLLLPDENLWRDAQRNLEEALRLSPNDFQAHKLMATIHFRLAREDEAINSLRASLAANPNQDAVFVGTLIELLERGRDGEALDLANEVIDKRPSDATLMLVAGRVFTQRESWARATVLFDRAWRLTKDQRIGMAYISTLLSVSPPKTADAGAVLGELERLGAKLDEDAMILGIRALVEQKGGKTARAEGFLTRAYEIALGNPGMVVAWFRDVRRVFDGADAGPAIRYVSTLRETMPAGTDQRDWLTYGIALLRTQDSIEIEEAESDLNQLKAEAGNEIIRRLSHRLLGSGRYNRKEYDAAAEAWRAGIAAFPDDWEMHNNLAYCIGIDLGKPADAVPLARQATVLADARADVWDTLGHLLLRTGELDEAETSLLAAWERIRTERERVNVLLNQARLALARKKTDEAVRLWTQADTAVYTLPDIRDAVQDDLNEVKAQIDSARGRD
jgi:tetratricopeptide (TPR) repeat protein